MMMFMVAALIAGPPPRVAVRVQVGPQQGSPCYATAQTSHAVYGHTLSIHDAGYYAPYFAYKVDDPETASLRRQNELLIEALTDELRVRRGGTSHPIKPAAKPSQPAAKPKVDPPKADPLPTDPLAPMPPTKPYEPAKPTAPRTAVNVVQESCAKCHGGGTAKGDYSLGAFNLAERILIGDVVAAGAMPPGKQLSDEDRRLIADWAAPSRADLKSQVKESK